jgi:signal transduction histidine kinase/ligand-binding sensor domain-containing protein
VPVRASAQVTVPPPVYAVSAWTTTEGVPQSAIYGLTRDAEGYLWIGTATGLARFDGDSFVSYPRGRPGQGVAISTFTTDRDGAIWVATRDSGVRLLGSAGLGRRIIGPSPHPVWVFAMASSDSMWMAYGHNIWFGHAGAWQRSSELSDSAVGLVRAMLVHHDALWVGDLRGILRMGGDGKVRRVRLPRSTEVHSFAPGRNGDLWAGTTDGLMHVSVTGIASPVTLLDMPPRRVRSLLAVGDGTLWVGDSLGAHRLEVTRDAAGTWRAHTTFSTPLDLDRSSAWVLLAGADSSIWVGTDGAGLRLVTPLRVARLTSEDGLPQRPIHHVVRDRGTGLWLSGGCTGLAHWRDGRLEHMDLARINGDVPCIHGMLRSRTGTLWAGVNGMFGRLDERTGRIDPVWRGLEEPNDVTPLLEDRAGRIWFGTIRGAAGFVAPGDSVTMLPPGTLSGTRPWSMIEDSTGIWIGQVGELTRLEGGQVSTRLGAADGMPTGPIRALRFDAAGDLWIASYGGGLARYRPGEGIRRLAPRGRRFEQALSSITIDRQDRFWFLGDAGLTVVERSELAAAVDAGRPLRVVTELGLSDGVAEGNNGFPNTWVDTVSNRLWAATVDGVVSADMNGALFDTIMPPVRIDDILVDGTSALSTDSVRIADSHDALTIHFTAPNYRGHDGLLFRYRLRGYDRSWIDGGAANVVRYAGIPPGRYTFDLVGRGRDGRETPPLAMPVVVDPAWWQAWPVRLGLAVVALALLYLVFQFLTRRLRARTRALQREIETRARAEGAAAAEASSLAHVSRLATAGELATSIAHELNQPLAAVVGTARTARHLVNAPDRAALTRTLDELVGESNRAADVVRTLRAFVQKQRPVTRVIGVDEVVADTLRLLRQELGSREVAVRLVDERRLPSLVQGDPVQLQQVLINLLLNAADAMSGAPAPARKATVLLRNDDDRTVRISVFDAGPGMPQDLIDRVFEPFFTTRKEGLGLGLSLSRSIVEASGGRLWAESMTGGSAFHVVLPTVEG